MITVQANFYLWPLSEYLSVDSVRLGSNPKRRHYFWALKIIRQMLMNHSLLFWLNCSSLPRVNCIHTLITLINGIWWQFVYYVMCRNFNTTTFFAFPFQMKLSNGNHNLISLIVIITINYLKIHIHKMIMSSVFGTEPKTNDTPCIKYENYRCFVNLNENLYLNSPTQIGLAAFSISVSKNFAAYIKSLKHTEIFILTRTKYPMDMDTEWDTDCEIFSNIIYIFLVQKALAKQSRSIKYAANFPGHNLQIPSCSSSV